MRRSVWFLVFCAVVGFVISVTTAQDYQSGDSGFSFGRSGADRKKPRVASQYFSRQGKGEADSNEKNAAWPDQADDKAAARPFGTGIHSPSRYQRSRGLSFDKEKGFSFDEEKSATDVNHADRNHSVPPSRNYLSELFKAVPTSTTDRSSSEPTAPAIGEGQHKHTGNPPLAPIEAGSRHRPLLAVPRSVQFTENSRPSGNTGRLRNADYQRAADASSRGSILPVRTTDEQVSPFSNAPKSNKSRTGTNPRPAETGSRAVMLPLPPLSKTQENPFTSSGLPTATATVTATTPDIRLGTVRPPVDVHATGPQTPMVTIHWIKRGETNVGQEFECQLYLTNSGKVTARNVVIDVYFPTSVRLTDATPAPAGSSDHLIWKFDELASGEKQVIKVRLIPSREGELAATAVVTFSAAASGLFRVSQPLLAVEIDGPQEVLIGQSASQVIKVSNPGTGIATNVTLVALIPEGLEHERGERLAMEIGSLNPGEMRIVRLALASVNGGVQVLDVEVAADGDLKQAESKTISVMAPSLAATIEGPEKRYVGHAARYTVLLTNDGDVDSNNVRAVYHVPPGFKFLRADKGGRYDRTQGTVSWFVGRMPPGESVQRSVYLTADGLGSFTHEASVSSEHGATAIAKLATLIEGTAVLAVEIIERDDPAEVGTETAFEVRVSNDGSKPAMNVGLSVELPSGVKYQSARGPSEHLAANGLLLFKSIERLDPGKTAIYRVYVLGTTLGKQRIRTRVVSDSISQPLISEEVTDFQAE